MSQFLVSQQRNYGMISVLFHFLHSKWEHKRTFFISSVFAISASSWSEARNSFGRSAFRRVSNLNLYSTSPRALSIYTTSLRHDIVMCARSMAYFGAGEFSFLNTNTECPFTKTYLTFTFYCEDGEPVRENLIEKYISKLLIKRLAYRLAAPSETYTFEKTDGSIPSIHLGFTLKICTFIPSQYINSCTPLSMRSVERYKGK